MVILFTLIHVLVCFFLIVVVLLQSGKAADLAGAFGGMGSQTAFGPRGSATILSKATTIAAGLFMLTSLSLAIVATRTSGAPASVLERQTQSPSQSGPAAPKPGAPGGATQTIPLNPQPPKPGAQQRPQANQPQPANPATPAPK
jgi:preprotein translocase subunit SecG